MAHAAAADLTENWSPTNRPLTLDEIADGIGIGLADLETLCVEEGVVPCFSLGGVRAYGPAQIRQIGLALGLVDHDAEPARPRLYRPRNPRRTDRRARR